MYYNWMEVVTLLQIITLYGIEARYIPLHLDDIIIITLDLGYASVSCNNNDIIILIGTTDPC